MLKRYHMISTHVGVIEEESDFGRWVLADDAQNEIDRLRSALRAIENAPIGLGAVGGRATAVAALEKAAE